MKAHFLHIFGCQMWGRVVFKASAPPIGTRVFVKESY
jgi:hypothetical protein